MSFLVKLCVLSFLLMDHVWANPISRWRNSARTQGGAISAMPDMFAGRKKETIHGARSQLPADWILSPDLRRSQTVTKPLLKNNTSSNGIVSSSAESHMTPQFMLDLFKRHESDPLIRPASNIIRSFFNEENVEEQPVMHQRHTSCDDRPGRSDCIRKHNLTFDISGMPHHERIAFAELRLYRIVEHDRNTYSGVDRKVELYEVRSHHHHHHHSTGPEKRLLGSKRIIGRRSGWEAFYITEAFRRWFRNRGTKVHLQVNIETISRSDADDSVDIEHKSNVKNEPLLIVFSNDANRHRRLERRDDTKRLVQSIVGEGIEEGLFNTRDPVRQSVDLQQSMSETANQQRVDVESDQSSDDLESNSRRRRSIHEPCHFEPMEINFHQIGYVKAINPRRYAAGKCVGTCEFPFAGMDTTRHAIFQGLMNLKSPNQHSKPCCVPTKLGPISMLYEEEKIITFDIEYEGMKVLECGCR